jgi:dephospho-CoA kinase
MFAGKPIIGIAGGIGSGKSFVAGLFRELGCLVISSDEQVSDVYRSAIVLQALRQWWGDQALDQTGDINRSFVAGRIFNDPEQRRRLEELIHPLVSEARQRAMEQAADDPAIVAFIWDTPLLFETGLNSQTDAVVFIDAPPELRLERLQKTRKWDAEELTRREKLQWPLDKKREISHYVIRNTADAGLTRVQVKDVLSRILSKAQAKL